MKPAKVLALVLAGAPAALGGPIAYGLCQAGCGTAVCACYAAAGFIFGTVAAAAAPPAIVMCNTTFGTCQAACAALAFAPTP